MVFKVKKTKNYRSEKERIYALGKNPSTTLTNIYKSFPALKKPKSGEWLKDHPELG